MPLDMICINQECNLNGIFCHKCFMENHHNHMSSDVMSFHKFIEKTQKTLDESYNQISLTNDTPLDQIREEYGTGRKILDNCKQKVHIVLTQYFEDIENTLHSSFKNIENDIEGPRTKISTDIEKYQATLKTLQSGGNNMDQTELNKGILSFLNVLQPSEDNNEFVLKAELLKQTTNGGSKEEKLKIFKEDNKKVQSCVEKIQDWLNKRPSFDETDTKRVQFPESTFKPSLGRGKITVGKMTIGKMSQFLPTSNLGKRPDIMSEIDNLKIAGSQPFKKQKVALTEIQENVKPSVKPTPIRNLGYGKGSVGRTFEESKKAEALERLSQSVNLGRSATKKHSNLTRFTLDGTYFDKILNKEVFALTFSTDREIFLIGFAQYMVSRTPADTPFLEYVLIQGDNIDDESSAKVLMSGTIKLNVAAKDFKMVPVLFDKQIKIQKSRFYTIKVTNKGPDLQLYRGTNGFDKKIPFSFYNAKSNEGKKVKNNVKKGQIPELYFIN